MYKYPYGDSQQLNLDWILAKLKELEDAAGHQITEDLEVISNALISATFSSSNAYNRSDIVFHDGKLYRANVNIPAPGESWNPAHWDEIMLGDTVSNLVTYLAALRNDQVFNSSNVPGTHTSDALNNLKTDISGLTSTKAEFLNLGNISSTDYPTRPEQIEQALNRINIYDKPVIFYYTSQGRWSGIALKYTGGQNGYIIASYPNDNNTYFGYLVNSVFTSHRFAGSSTDTTNVSNVTGSTVTDALNNLNDAINAMKPQEITVSAHADTTWSNDAWFDAKCAANGVVTICAGINITSGGGSSGWKSVGVVQSGYRPSTAQFTFGFNFTGSGIGDTFVVRITTAGTIQIMALPNNTYCNFTITYQI